MSAAPTENAPVTAASIAAAVNLCLASFTSFSAEQIGALNAVIAILAAFAVQRWHTDPRSNP